MHAYSCIDHSIYYIGDASYLWTMHGTKNELCDSKIKKTSMCFTYELHFYSFL